MNCSTFFCIRVDTKLEAFERRASFDSVRTFIFRLRSSIHFCLATTSSLAAAASIAPDSIIFHACLLSSCPASTSACSSWTLPSTWDSKCWSLACSFSSCFFSISSWLATNSSLIWRTLWIVLSFSTIFFSSGLSVLIHSTLSSLTLPESSWIRFWSSGRAAEASTTIFSAYTASFRSVSNSWTRSLCSLCNALRSSTCSSSSSRSSNTPSSVLSSLEDPSKVPPLRLRRC
mmetsp:Transcript_4443/g.28313  ORF Transcript_4443/g.28313 Transcript_4443/m.28313 type:complete len:231 (+) Transcript_4443:1034-1726(+)